MTLPQKQKLFPPNGERLPSMGLVPASMSEAMRFAEMMAN